MARDVPYSQFNFLVDLGDFQAGFQEVSGLGVEVTVAEYREGSEVNNAVRKVNTMYKIPDITLKRGIAGARDLFEWLQTVKTGSQETKTVTIQLLDEEHNPAMTWEVKGARPIKYTGPSLNGKGTDVAVEELTLACEELTVK